MDLMVRLYLERAENEAVFANAAFELSVSDKAKEALNITKNRTFFSNAISQSYYSIFYCAKSYLLTKGIRTKPPEEHKKTYEEFRKIVFSGELDKKLLEIYENIMLKAETLLGIFKMEKGKRGFYTYHVDAKANLPIAKESLENARKFFSNMEKIITSSKG